MTTEVIFLKVIFERQGLGQAPGPCLTPVVCRQSVVAVLAGVTDVTVSAGFHSFKVSDWLLLLAVNTSAGARDLIPRDKWWW